MIVTLTSARGGTGVTTAAVGLAAVWPRPVLLVEADPCGYSAILAGTLAASVPWLSVKAMRVASCSRSCARAL